MADDKRTPMRGGRMLARDPWFGLRGQPGFESFKRYWHREKRHHGGDLQTREEAFDAYDAWAVEHLPNLRS